MKTAEEWVDDFSTKVIALCTAANIKAIQSDAERSGYERGVRQAANICESLAAKDDDLRAGVMSNPFYSVGCRAAKKEIEALLNPEQKT